MTTEISGAGPDGERPKRPPPTIDLDPSEVTVEKDPGSREQGGKRAWFGNRTESTRGPSFGGPSFEKASGALTPALSGATAAALILTGAWLLGLSGDNRSQQVTAAAPADTTAVNTLTAKLAKLESDVASKANVPSQPAADPAQIARIDQIETSLKSINESVAALRADIERVASAKPPVTAASRDADPATAPDFSAIDQRFAQIESAQRALGEAAQRAARPADDRPLRRAVAASALDLSVRQSEPFASALAAARSAAPDAGLQPLDAFAVSGLPGDASLARELLALLPQLSPSQPKQVTTGGAGGVLDRLQESAGRLVKVERVDAATGDRSAQTGKIAAAARANDIAAAKAALMELPATERTPAQGWLDRVAARDAARETSRRFAADALAALGKPAQ